MALVDVFVPTDPTDPTDPTEGPDDDPTGRPVAEVVAHVGDDVVVRLEDRSGSTGYQWWVVETPDLLAAAGDLVAPHRPGEDGLTHAVGVPGEHVFTYRAAGAGEGVLSFALRRVWEPDPVATVTVRVVVS